MHGCFAGPKKTGCNNEVAIRRGSSVFTLLSNKSASLAARLIGAGVVISCTVKVQRVMFL